MMDFRSFYVDTLGCPKNEVDSRIIIKHLTSLGKVYKNPEHSDVIIINSCGFLQEALNELYERISYWKKHNKELIVTGCAVERLGLRYLEGNGLRAVYLDTLVGISKGKRRKGQTALPTFNNQYFTRDSIFHYTKSQEGCTRRCSYCVISKIKGPLRSRPLTDIIREIEGLYSEGVQEFILIAQDLSLYGIDIGEKLQSLLKNLPIGPYYRLMYLHPHGINEDIIRVIDGTPGILPYLHIPIQHISNRVLKDMKRAGGERSVRRSVELVRKHLPQFFIRVDIMVGFPTETDQDFEHLLTFMEDLRPERISIFKYSSESSTPSQRFEELDEDVKEERYEMAFEIAHEIMAKVQSSLVGYDIIVFKQGEDTWSQYDAPYIDFGVELKNNKVEIWPCKAKIIDVKQDLDLVGVKVEH